MYLSHSYLLIKLWPAHESTRQSTKVVRSTLEILAGQTGGTANCPTINSRFRFRSEDKSFEKIQKSLLWTLLWAIVHRLTNLPSLVMAQFCSMIWLQIYYNFILELLYRSVIGRQLGFPFLYFNLV